MMECLSLLLLSLTSWLVGAIFLFQVRSMGLFLWNQYFGTQMNLADNYVFKVVNRCKREKCHKIFLFYSSSECYSSQKSLQNRNIPTAYPPPQQKLVLMCEWMGVENGGDFCLRSLLTVSSSLFEQLCSYCVEM